MTYLTNKDPAARAVIGVDPDGAHTALCALYSDGTAVVVGGGSRADGRRLCAVQGVLDVLAEMGGPKVVALVVIETQAANSQWSAACDGVRRARYMWEAACELAGVPYSACDPQAWQRQWVGPKTPENRTSRVSARVAKTTGSHPLREAADAQSKARAATIGLKLSNPDQRSALGLAAYGASRLSWAMPWD